MHPHKSIFQKGVQNILLLVAVITVIGHTILPHIRYDEILVALHQHHHDEEPPAGQHHEDDNSKETPHSLFSFAQLDENFVPVNGQNNSFELTLTYLSALIATYLSNDFPVITKTHFGCYKVFPPPEKYFASSAHRGPPKL